MEEDSLTNRVRAHVNAVYTRLCVTPRYQRRFHAFCVGTEKSGTHSVAALTARSYRSDHEPDFPWLIPRFTESRFDRPEQWDTYLHGRDRRLWLEMESNWLLIFTIEQLVHVFPNARIILTIRDCRSWLDSLANHVLANDVGPRWRQAQRADYRVNEFTHEREKRLFATPAYTLFAPTLTIGKTVITRLTSRVRIEMAFSNLCNMENLDVPWTLTSHLERLRANHRRPSIRPAVAPIQFSLRWSV